MPTARRSELEIEIALLDAIRTAEAGSKQGPRITRVQANVNLNWDALKRYLEKLRESGFVETDPLRLTERGHVLLQAYHDQVESLLDKFRTPTDDSTGDA